MGNVVDLRVQRSVFDAVLARKAARTFKGTTQLAARELADATPEQGVIEMKATELGRRIGKGRYAVLHATQELVASSIVSRDESVSWRYTWNLEKVAELAKQVASADAKFATTHLQNSSECKFRFPNLRIVWLNAEKQARSEKPESMRFGASEEPALHQYVWLDGFCAEKIASEERTLEFVALDGWRRWLRIKGNDEDKNKYERNGWPFSYLVRELQRNKDFNRDVGRRRVQIHEEPASSQRLSARDNLQQARDAFARVAGGAQ